MSDVRFAIRQLAKSPGFTAIAVLTLALGIGASTAMFTVVNGVLLRPLPFPEPERLVVVNETSPRRPETTVGIGKYVQWKTHAESFAEMGALAGQSYNLTGVGEPAHLVGARITASVLTTLRLSPLLGRNFQPDEERPFGQENTVILGHGLWQTRFGGRPDVVGTTIQLSDRAFTVIGVMPSETGLPERYQIFMPMGLDGSNAPFVHMLARLKPEFTAADAGSEMAVVIERVAAAHGRPSPRAEGWSVKVTPLVDTMVGNVRPALLSLLGAVGLLLLIACTNVASLLLARATARAGEIAVRAALGANRRRVIRQLLIESLLLALLGAGLGLLFAQAGVAALLGLAPEALPRATGIAVDGRVLAVTTAVAGLSAVLFGLVPALQASRVQLTNALRQGGRGAGGGTRQPRLRRALVSGQVALALVLLAGAGLLMRSFARLQEVHPGFDAGNAYVAETFLPRPKYANDEQYLRFAQDTLGEIAALPGVEAAAVANNLPFSKHHATYPMLARVGVPGQAAPAALQGGPIVANESSVSADYFRAMGIPLLRGRPFDGRDVVTGAPAAIVSESLAKRLYPGQDPLGKALLFGAHTRQIVAVVGDVKQASLEAEASMQVYRPWTQNSDNDVLFVVRTRPTTGGAGLPRAIRAAITRPDPTIPVFAAQPLAAVLGESIGRQRFALALFAVFSGLALLLAAIGLYGVMAFSVSQRTSEIGLRMALGARSETVARLILVEGGRLVVIGVGAGLLGTLLVSRSLEKLLYGVRPYDPLTLVAVALFMAVVAVLACLLPALRASRLDPMTALRAS